MNAVQKAATRFQGVAGRDAGLATKYLSPRRYVEHDPRVPDGVEGLREYVDQLPAGDLRVEVVRALRDGPFVVTQAQGSVGGRQVFFDVFRFEDGLVVEHWGFPEDVPPRAEWRNTNGVL